MSFYLTGHIAADGEAMAHMTSTLQDKGCSCCIYVGFDEQTVTFNLCEVKHSSRIWMHKMLMRSKGQNYVMTKR
jgi:hypothetical protein